ncbi:MAG: protein kinase [Polyangiales bacterium]
MTASNQRSDPTLGATVLHGYVVTAHMRSEVRGECYRGRSLRDGEGDVVLRFMPRSVFAPGPRSSWSPLWAYAERLQRLDHPNLERVLECGMTLIGDEERFCVVSDAVDGESLLSHIRARGSLDVAEALTLGRQIAQGMAALHRLGVVHGDLRVTNIALAKSASNDGADARPVVCELGLTSLALQAEGAPTSLRAMMISPESIAPEQIRGELATTSTDIYAFGTILYRMLTGVAAFQGDNTSQTLRAHLTRTPAPLRDRVPDAPDSIEALVRGCLVRRPDGRYPSFDAMLAQLHECEAKVLSIASTRSPSWVTPRVTPGASPIPAKASDLGTSSPPVSHKPAILAAEAPANDTEPRISAPEPLEDEPSQPAHESPSAGDSASARASATPQSPPPRRSFAPTLRISHEKVGASTRVWLRAAAVLTVLFGAALGYAVSSEHAPARSENVAAAATIRFEVRSSARGASATIRGRTYPVPIEVELSRGSAPEIVEVSAPGHLPRSVSLYLDRTMRVELDLDPLPAASSAAPSH